MNNEISVPIVLSSGVDLPAYATPGSAGLDLRASHAHEIEPMGRAMVPTGIRIAVPMGYEAQIRPRSGLAIKHGITMINSPGTIDSDFRGEVQVLIVNLGSETFEIKPGDRIAQMVFCPVARAEFKIVPDLPGSERGEGGFGSTGHQ